MDNTNEEQIPIEILEKELENINSIPDVVSVKVEPGKLTIHTTPIYMDGVLLGNYKIELMPNSTSRFADNKIKIHNERKKVFIPASFKEMIFEGPIGSGTFHHPHIWINRIGVLHICFGNIKLGVLSLLESGEFVALTMVLLEFLKRSFGWKGIEKEEMLEFWKEEKEETKYVKQEVI